MWVTSLVVCSAELTVRETLDFAARVQGPDFGEQCLTAVAMEEGGTLHPMLSLVGSTPSAESLSIKYCD